MRNLRIAEGCAFRALLTTKQKIEYETRNVYLS
jgi:hypothetical protein